jgi:hypothetical protein
VFVETNKKYRISVTRLPVPGKWSFFGEQSYMGGQPISHLPPLKSITMAALYPFRRTFDRPWSSIIFRIGSKGNEEDFLDRAPPKQSDRLLVNEADDVVPDEPEKLAETLTPKRDGELFVYLNKSVLGLWGYESWLADRIGNFGRAKILVENLGR